MNNHSDNKAGLPPGAALTHFDADGRAHMVDVGGKPPSKRIAIAEGWIAMRRETLMNDYQQLLDKVSTDDTKEPIARYANAFRDGDVVLLTSDRAHTVEEIEKIHEQIGKATHFTGVKLILLPRSRSSNMYKYLVAYVLLTPLLGIWFVEHGEYAGSIGVDGYPNGTIYAFGAYALGTLLVASLFVGQAKAVAP